MSELVIHCIPASGADTAVTAADLASFLQDSGDVESVSVEVESSRGIGPAEILAIVQLAAATVDLTQRLLGFVKSRHSTVHDIEIEIDGRRVSVTTRTDDNGSA